MTIMRSAIINYMLEKFAHLRREDDINVDARIRKEIAEHAADSIDRAVLSWDSEEVQDLSARIRIYLEKEAVNAYSNKLRDLIMVDIEKAAQRQRERKP